MEKLFQSHNGAIAAACQLSGSSQRQRFQSHNGAIAAICNEPISDLQRDVSIPQWCDCCTTDMPYNEPEKLSFNPTMVRLLPSSDTSFKCQGARFNPTMVRLLHRECLHDCLTHSQFQSHNGAIAASPKFTHMKVYLWFQSHNGAIAAFIFRGSPSNSKTSFNPTMVRLLLYIVITLWAWWIVSIPQWCDCCNY